MEIWQWQLFRNLNLLVFPRLWSVLLESCQISSCVLCVVCRLLSSLIPAVPSSLSAMQAYLSIWLPIYPSQCSPTPSGCGSTEHLNSAPGVQPVQGHGQKEEPYWIWDRTTHFTTLLSCPPPTFSLESLIEQDISCLSFQRVILSKKCVMCFLSSLICTLGYLQREQQSVGS